MAALVPLRLISVVIKEGSNFFGLVWQINMPSTDEHSIGDFGRVDLRVEASSYEIDSLLNDLKSELVNSILSANLKQLVSRNGFRYKVGRLIADTHVRKYKSTTVFSVELD